MFRQYAVCLCYDTSIVIILPEEVHIVDSIGCYFVSVADHCTVMSKLHNQADENMRTELHSFDLLLILF